MVYWPTPGETAAGSAGEQPDQGIARLGSSRRCATGWGEQLTPHPNIHHIGSIDPPCLKKLPPEGRNYLLTKSGHSPLPAEPRQRGRKGSIRKMGPRPPPAIATLRFRLRRSSCNTEPVW